MTIIKRTSLLISCFVAAFYVRADNSDNLFVTANRFLQPVSSILAPATLVTRDDIERWQAKSVVDIMRRLPGVDIAQNGGLGQKSSLFIRGTESRHVLLLIDGIRFDQAGISGSSDLSQFPVSLIQRIEYIRGPRSAVYGSDAIGAVVNIITKREKLGSTASMGGGSGAYQTYDLSTQQQIARGSLITFASNYTHLKGYDVKAQGNVNVPQGDRDGFMTKSIYGAFEHLLNQQLSFFLTGYGYGNRTDYDGVLDTQKTYYQNWNSGLRYQRGQYSSQLIASYGHNKEYNYSAQQGQYSPSTALNEVEQYNVQWGNILKIGQGSLSAGIDWQQQQTEPNTATIVAQKTQNIAGSYLATQQQLGSLILEGAVRADKYSEFGWQSTWQTSASWEFINGYQIILSYGSAFKAPNMSQLYSNYYGNSSLKPEESKQWEGGIEGKENEVNWRISGYRNTINNLIDSDPLTYRYYNIGKVSIKGVEATMSFDMGAVTHQLSYDYVNPRNVKTGEFLPRRAKHQLQYELYGQFNDFGYSLTYQYLGQRYDKKYMPTSIQPEKVKLGGVSLWDIATSYSVTSHLTVRGRIANLFAKDYETAYGYATPGREYFLTGSYTF